MQLSSTKHLQFNLVYDSSQNSKCQAYFEHLTETQGDYIDIVLDALRK